MEELGQRMSAREFNQWAAFLDEEGLGPGAHTVQHAQLLAALHNGPCVPPQRRKSWGVADFLSRIPWTTTTPRAPDGAGDAHLRAIFGDQATPASTAAQPTLAELRAAAKRAGMPVV